MFGRGEAERSLSPSREFPLQLQLISAPWIKGWSTESAAMIAELRYIDPFTVLIISGHSGCRGMTFRDSELTIESVMRRLLRGGQLVHSQNGSVCNTPFQALTLYHVGALVQHHIVGEQESVQRQQRLAAGNVIQMPEMQARISEEALMGRGQSSKGRTAINDTEGFLSKDAVLSSAWTCFKGTHFTESNRFFTAMADLPVELQRGGGFLRKVMNDAAIVRLLEVAGYIDFVGPAVGGRSLATLFYESVPRGWVFPSLEPQNNGQWQLTKRPAKRSA